MSTGDEEADRLVDDLFREVDDQFADLEREYHQAREGMATADSERRDKTGDALVASNERFELMSQVATLQAEVSRQRDELDERDRMLTALGDKIAGFEADIANRDETLAELTTARHDAADARREQARLSALLDARAAERQELADVAHRLQNERDNLQDLLTTALARFDEAESAIAQMDDKLRHLEAARDTAAREHDARAHELIESRAEMSKLTDQLADLTRSSEAATERAVRAEALAERRTNEAGYLNRRIEALAEKVQEAEAVETEAKNLRRELVLVERRISELERALDAAKSEAAASNAAVDAIADRTADYDELVAKVARLQEERDAAWEAASGYPRVPMPPDEVEQEPDDVAALADQARELGARRASEAELAANAAEDAADAARAGEASSSADEATREPHDGAPRLDAISGAAGHAGGPIVMPATDDEFDDAAAAQDALAGLEELDEDDIALIDDDLAMLTADEPTAAAPTGQGIIEFDGNESLPRIDLGGFDAQADPAVAGTTEPPSSAPRVTAPGVVIDSIEIPTADDAADSAEIPTADDTADSAEIPSADDTADSAEVATADEPDQVEEPGPEVIPLITLDHLAGSDESDDTAGADDGAGSDDRLPPVVAPGTPAARKRTILPADLEPNTPEAVAHLLNQPGVTAIVDARSTCGRTGIRPSELFERIQRLRDHFDVPVEVVVTPVSTPVGGAPDLPAIGVHYVTGADTVADRIRALCMGLPADQPLVVIAGDDHVRRAAIGEEANVVEPGAVLNLVAG